MDLHTIVDSHAALKNSKSASIPAHEVRAVATPLQLFNKVDLQAVMKAGRWSSVGTFISSYLCPQADSLRKTGPVWQQEWSVFHPARRISFPCALLATFREPCWPLTPSF